MVDVTGDTVVLVLSTALVALAMGLLLTIRYYRDRIEFLHHDLRVERGDPSAHRTMVAGLLQPAPAHATMDPLVAAAELSGGSYPFDRARFRFLGTPVSGIQFEADRVLFVDLGGPASPDSNHVRKLVEEKKVEWISLPGAGHDASQPSPAEKN
jgi:hypothetical protein